MNREVISSASLLDFTMLLLEDVGFMPSKELSTHVDMRFGANWTDGDKLMIRGRPKWQNQLDWAKAVGCHKHLITTVKWKGECYVVLLGEPLNDDHKQWIDYATSFKKKKGFRKRCQHCKAQTRLSSSDCSKCKRPFPLKLQRYQPV